jgi:hypothetical protein
MNAGNSYFPFVRLALARYQPNSIEGVELSRVVTTDFVQLVPDRTLETTFSADKKEITVLVAGVKPSQTFASKHSIGDFLNQVEVSVERQAPEIATDLGWMPSAEAVVHRDVQLERLAISRRVPVLWAGKATLPEPAGTKKYRLVVKEFELFYEDAPDVNNPGAFSGTKPAQRLVYADMVVV